MGEAAPQAQHGRKSQRSEELYEFAPPNSSGRGSIKRGSRDRPQPESESIPPVADLRDDDIVETVNRLTLIESALTMEAGMREVLAAPRLIVSRVAMLVLARPTLPLVRVSMLALVVV
jgi:hypothetical protein